jgi:2-polyprenyl-3-methyl-5-hydroxy-6-metoxy-1,4-benzoquinol methylase
MNEPECVLIGWQPKGFRSPDETPWRPEAFRSSGSQSGRRVQPRHNRDAGPPHFCALQVRRRNMPEDLTEFRLRAARCSGGTSSDSIKRLVLRIVRDHTVAGRILDFGAGTGELINLMGRLHGVELYGADILPRPTAIPAHVEWHQGDLNENLDRFSSYFDAVICSEVIEHLENPRSTFRNIHRLLKPGGKLLLTMPNQENIRSYLNLIFRGHFAQFRGPDYPAHITALLRLDLVRICAETGFSEPRFLYTDYGWMPITRMTWQKFSFNLLGGRLFSDNVAMVVSKLASGLTPSARKQKSEYARGKIAGRQRIDRHSRS